MGWSLSQLWGRSCVWVCLCECWCSWTSFQREEAQTIGGLRSAAIRQALIWTRLSYIVGSGLPTIPCAVFTTRAKSFLSAIPLRQRMLSIVALLKFVRRWGESPVPLSFLGKKSLLGLLHQVGCVCEPVEVRCNVDAHSWSSALAWYPGHDKTMPGAVFSYLLTCSYGSGPLECICQPINVSYTAKSARLFVLCNDSFIVPAVEYKNVP